MHGNLTRTGSCFMSAVSLFQEEAGSTQQEGGEQREEEGGKMEADKPDQN